MWKYRPPFVRLSLLALGAAACSEVVTLAPGEAQDDPATSTLCGQPASPDARVLVAGAREGVLVAGDEALFLVEDGGRALRIDRCTGQVTELADAGDLGRGAVISHGAYLYWASGEKGARRLFRVSSSGGARELVTEALPWIVALGAQGERVFVHSHVETPTVSQVHALDASSAPAQVDAPLFEHSSGVGAVLSGFEVGPSGAFSMRWPHGGESELVRIPNDGGNLEEVQGTRGTQAFAATDGWVYFWTHDEEFSNADFPEGIFRAPVAGGTPERLVSEDRLALGGGEVWPGELISDDVGLCWAGTGGAPRCVRLGAGQTADPRVLTVGGGEPVSRHLVFSGDGVYWLSKSDGNATGVDVLGAAR